MTSYPGDIEYGKLHVLKPTVAETLLPEAQARSALFGVVDTTKATLARELAGHGPVVGDIDFESVDDPENGVIRIRARAMIRHPKNAATVLRELCRL